MRTIRTRNGSCSATRVFLVGLTALLLGGTSIGVAGRAMAADTAPPTGAFTAPTSGQVLTSNPVSIRGTATDDVGVRSVDVAVLNRTTSRWLAANGTWDTTMVWLPASGFVRGARSTTWSFSFTATSGSYNSTVRAKDTSGKIDPAPRPWRGFSVSLLPPPSGAPNVVLILTDDQRWDTLWSMPNVQSLLADRGVTFTNGFVANALCCPSRANILKGAYSHSTHVYANSGVDGPFSKFDDKSTVATWMNDAGYRTGLVGKYFNGYDPTRATYVPPGWDRWVAFATTDVGGGAYLNYGLSVDGAYRTYGSTAVDYSTDVLAGYADTFIRSTPAEEPLFLYFAPYSPHETAATEAAPRHASMFSDIAPFRPPSYDESDVSDKPSYIKSLPRLVWGNSYHIDTLRRQQYRTLQATDEAVAQLVGALKDTGRLSNTMIVFTSDNGFLWGEHRWGKRGDENKQVPYEESIRVPYVVRYDPLVTSPRIDRNMVLNIDLAPTFTALAGAASPGAEGRSLLPLLSAPGSVWRTDFLIEHGLTNVPTYCAVRSTDALYVRYATGEQELYLLSSDPYQLDNQAENPAYATLLSSLRSRAVELCSPTPPGYSFSATVATSLSRSVPTE